MAGRASSKDWKRSIRYAGRPLQCLIQVLRLTEGRGRRRGGGGLPGLGRGGGVWRRVLPWATAPRGEHRMQA